MDAPIAKSSGNLPPSLTVPSVREHMDPKEYYAISMTDAVSFSQVSNFASERSPKHFWAKNLQENQSEKSFNINFYHGALFHQLAEVGEEQFFATHVEVPTGMRKGSHHYYALLEGNPGKKPVRTCDLRPILAMYQALASTRTYQKIASKAAREVSLFWGYEGHTLKGRADIILPEQRLILDLKTTRNADPYRADGFQKSITDYRYHWQAAFYTWGMREITGHDYRFGIVATEKEAPHATAFFEISKEQIAQGHRELKPFLDRLLYCLKSNDWGDGYGEQFHTQESLQQSAFMQHRDLDTIIATITTTGAARE